MLIFFRAKQGALIIFFGIYSIKKRLIYGSRENGLKKLAKHKHCLPG
ncbi:hypothetical protein DB41_KC00070 [Neochlamydia sp. TUME1]|nr:hypothetical protein DB41_KC00070 [Neochlamydia sp. TUME1]